jgi:hypothetical protein
MKKKLCRRYFMNPSLVFVSGLAVTCLTSLASVIYMQRPLRALLEELCGTRHRADFWTIFSNIAVTLVPAIFAMHYEPDSHTTLLEVARQVKLGLVGLATSILLLGLVLSRFIPRPNPTGAGAASAR